MKPIKLTEAEKVLLRAADYIEEYGWIQGAPATAHGICALQAIHFCCRNYAEEVPARAELERRIRCEVTRWNDDPDRTKEDVLATLRCVD